MKKLILLACLTMLCYLNTGAVVVYVNKNATGSNNGSSWANAFVSLQPGINAAYNGGQVWVAAGTYSPMASSFYMQEGAAIYGGFSGVETSLSQRDWKVNITTLKGDGTHPVIENYFTANSPLDGNAILDGFTITNGNAGGSFSSIPDGGGIYNRFASPTLRNLIITGNSATGKGGGIYGLGCSSILENITISNNIAGSGGGIYFEDGAFVSNSIVYPVLTKVLVESNTGHSRGGGIYLYNSQPKIVSSIIRKNTSNADNGGGIYALTGPNFSMVNCLVVDNQASAAGGIFLTGGTSVGKLLNITVSNNKAMEDNTGGLIAAANLEMSNSIVFGNKKNTNGPGTINPDYASNGAPWNIKFCVISGFGASPDNFEVNPEFIDPANGDYSLAGKSPLINLGNNTFYTSTETLDLDNNIRIFNNTIDIGAYEFQGYVSVEEKEGVNPVKFYPNPARNSVTLELSQPATAIEVTVTDVSGKLLLSRKTVGVFQEIISLTDWAPGLYFVKATTPEWQASSKFCVIE